MSGGGGEPERPQFLFVKALASRGRLEAVTQQMGYHPRYLDSFLKTQHYLLHMDGPLPFDCRHYIAIMVSVGPPGVGDASPQKPLWGRFWGSQHPFTARGLTSGCRAPPRV